MNKFKSLMRRADTLRRIETDPIKSDWLAGYMRGLRRAHHGDNFGTQSEHELWLSAIDSSDESRAALGRGYHAGLTMEPRDPDTKSSLLKASVELSLAVEELSMTLKRESQFINKYLRNSNNAILKLKDCINKKS